MAALVIRIAGVNVSEYVQQETIRIESSGSALASTCTFRVQDRLGEAKWLQVPDKAEVLIDDGATRLFGGRINIPTDEHDGPIRDWEVRASDYTTQLEEHICVNSFFEAGSSDSAMIAAIFAAWCAPIDAATHVDTLEANMPEMHLNSITIREAMDQICRKTGGMFYVDFYRFLHYFSADEGVAAPFGLSTEPDMATLFPYERFRRRLNATRIVNNVLVVGNGIEVWREHAASIAHYGTYYQDVIRDGNIQTIAEAEDYGDWYLARYAWPHDEPRLTCRRAGLRAGMNIRLINSVHVIDQVYSIRRAVIRCTGSYEPDSPQYMVDLQLGAQDAPGRPDLEPRRDVPPPSPPPYVPPDEGALWTQEVYIATTNLGVFYTPDFVADSSYITGVPTWTAISTGLNLAEDCLGFRGDPFNPATRQYILMEDGVYRREGVGNWVSMLTMAQALAIVGGDQTPNPLMNGFGPNGLACNINREGWLGVLFWNTNVAHTQLKASLLYSTDFGDTWAEGVIADWAASNQRHPFSLTVGAYKGSSPHGAGQVMYCGLTFSTWLAVSTDGGLTWAYGAQLNVALAYGHILVDPSDQSRVFVGCRDGAGPLHVAVSLDHGATIADYDLNGSEPMGYGSLPSTYYHLSVAMDERRAVRVGAQVGRQHIHTTRDDGGTWDEPTPQYSSLVLGISLIQDSPDFLYLLKQLSGVAGPPPANCETVWASEDEGRTMIPKSGANACTINTGGGDSLPYNHGGVRGILEVWTSWGRAEVPGVPTEHSIGAHPGDISRSQYENMDVTGLSGLLADPQTPLAHDILSAYHGDTLAAAVSRGSLIVGNATPKWSELVIGAADDVLLSDGVDASWGPLRAITVNDANPGLTITQAGAGASLSLPSATTAAKGLILGADVALYRSAADILATPDNLYVAGGNLEVEGSGVKIDLTNTGLGANTFHTEILGATGIVRFYQGNDATQLYWQSSGNLDRMSLDLGAGRLHLPVVGAAAGLLIGGSVALYRSAPNELMISGTMVASGGGLYGRVDLILQGLTGFTRVSAATYVHLESAAGQGQYYDAGGIFTWRDQDAADAIRMKLDSATGHLKTLGYIYPGTGAAIQSTRYFRDDGTNLELNVGSARLNIFTTGAWRGLVVRSTQDGATGARMELDHAPTTPAINDYPAAYSAAGRDDEDNYTSWGDMRWQVMNVDHSAVTEESRWLLYNRLASAANTAMYVTGAGEIFADLDGSGGDHISTFDEFDDALVLRQVSQGAIEMLLDLGIAKREPKHRGYMVSLQKLAWLLAGGIYQNRAKIDLLQEDNRRMRRLLEAG